MTPESIHDGPPYKVVPPPVISWFINHISIDISTINHSEMEDINQLNAILGVPHCMVRLDHLLKIVGEHDIITQRETWEYMGNYINLILIMKWGAKELLRVCQLSDR